MVDFDKPKKLSIIFLLLLSAGSIGLMANSDLWLLNGSIVYPAKDTWVVYENNSRVCTQNNGICATSGGNPFDQNLNTTDDVTFSQIITTGNVTGLYDYGLWIAGGGLQLSSYKIRTQLDIDALNISAYPIIFFDSSTSFNFTGLPYDRTFLITLLNKGSSNITLVHNSSDVIEVYRLINPNNQNITLQQNEIATYYGATNGYYLVSTTSKTFLQNVTGGSTTTDGTAYDQWLNTTSSPQFTAVNVTTLNNVTTINMYNTTIGIVGNSTCTTITGSSASISVC